MRITSHKILQLNPKYDLISGLSEREMKNPEGVGFDLRVGQVHRLKEGGYLGVEKRKTPDIEKVADIADGSSAVTLGPEDFVLITTMETVNAPAEKIELEPGSKPVHVMIDVYPRSTLQRSGVFFRGTKIDPGYKGTLTFGMRNLSQFPFTFELGARVANIVFTTVHGDLARAYEGQWQGGRISTGGFEKQN
ncbi:MAG TPA: hypothetical protein VJH22_04605 [Candidatus Nanoarchaeia archaeon]|nr:hypothetical protein [Candidatus Nanoarchaeia archaeon]